MTEKLREKKAQKEAAVPEGPEGGPADDEVPAAYDAVGRVVGGAERHGQILVELLDQGQEGGAAEPILCEIPRGRRAPKEVPIVGDMLRVILEPGVGMTEASVAEVLPRKTTLLRRHPTTPAKPQLLCANLDLVVLVVSVEPNFSEGMVDRILVSAHAQGLEVAIVLNKADLVPEGSAERHDVDRRLRVYERVGYPV